MNETFYHILPSGLQIVHRQTTSEVAYVGIMVGAGTRAESPAENGMAHYIEHCVFKGCQHHSLRTSKTTQLNAKQIIEKMEGVGGEVNAYTTKEETVFYAATPKIYFDRALQTLCDMVFRPTFPKKETDKEVEVILEEIESYNDSPSELIYDDFENLLFAGNSLAMPILGTRKTLRHISKNNRFPLQWMGHNYRPERMVIFSQGNLPFATVLRSITKATTEQNSTYLNSSSETTHPLPTPCTENIEKIRTYHKHTHQIHLMLGARAYALGHKYQLGLYLLNTLLGGGSLSSRLNMALRERRGLVYSIESQYTPLSDTGYWSIYLATETADKDLCYELCLKELKRLREERLSTAQHQRILTQLKGLMAISAENQENNALTMGKQMLYHHTAPCWQETYERIAQIPTSTLQDIANEVYQENLLSTLIYE